MDLAGVERQNVGLKYQDKTPPANHIPISATIAVRTHAMATTPDYYVATWETDVHPNPWRWEIRRHSKPMGVKIDEGGFRSQPAAEFAGRRALQDFMEQLAAEERRGSRSRK